MILALPALLLLALLAFTVKEQGSREPLVIGETDGEVTAEETGAPLVIDLGTDGTGGGDSSGEDAAGEAAGDSSTRLLFAGDVLLSDHVLNAYDRAGGIHGVVDEAIRQTVGQADIFMANQEFPFSERGTAAEDKQFTFRLPLSRVPMMNELGLDLVTLANNHALDFGADALLDTCAALDGAGILRVGAGADLDEARAPVFIEKNGIRFGFIGVSRVIPEGGWAAGASRPGMFTTYDTNHPHVLEEIETARGLCDYLIVYVHWGIERNTSPEEYQRILGQKYIDAGADMVIGSHPHVLQGIEYYNGCPIVYSLGNFVFGSSIPKTMLLEAEFAAGETAQEPGQAAGKTLSPRLRLIPCTSSAGYTTAVTDPAAMQAFYREMEGLSFGLTVDENGCVIP